MAEQKLTDEEKRQIEIGREQSRQLIQTVQHGGLLEKTVDAVANETPAADVVNVIVTQAFTLTTDDKKRIRFPIGGHRCPKALFDHWYVKAHGVQLQDLTAPVPEITAAILVPPGLPAEVEIGDSKVPIADVALSAVRNLQVSPAVWNALPDADKVQVINEKIRLSQEAAKAEAAADADHKDEAPKGGRSRK